MSGSPEPIAAPALVPSTSFPPSIPGDAEQVEQSNIGKIANRRCDRICRFGVVAIAALVVENELWFGLVGDLAIELFLAFQVLRLITTEQSAVAPGSA